MVSWEEFLARATAEPADIDQRADAVAPDDVSDILFTSGTTGGARARCPRTGRHWTSPEPGPSARG